MCCTWNIYIDINKTIIGNGECKDYGSLKTPFMALTNTRNSKLFKEKWF